MKKYRAGKFLAGMTIAAAGLIALPALANEAMTKSDVDFFYAQIEGGYGWFDGALAITPSGDELHAGEGAYGTLTLGHVSIDDGIIGGYVDRAELWFSYFDHGDDFKIIGIEPVSFERDYLEAGVRFQHYFDQTATNKLMWGLEPFIGRFSDHTDIAGGIFEVETDVYGAMLSLEYEHLMTPETMLLFRAAGGIYQADTGLTTGSGSASDDATGFRGQLGVEVQHKINARTSIGVAGRLDYFSDVARLEATAPPNGISYDDLLGVFVGANLTYIFAGTYQ